MVVREKNCCVGEASINAYSTKGVMAKVILQSGSPKVALQCTYAEINRARWGLGESSAYNHVCVSLKGILWGC